MPLRRKAREGEESPDAPARKSARRRGVTWCPCAEKACKGEESPDAPAQKSAQRRLVTWCPWLIAVQGHSDPRPLLPRAGCAGKSVKRPGKSPQAVSNCSNLCDSVCSLKCIYLRKRALSSSLSQYSAARPASERYRATAHVGYSFPALASASNDQAAKAAMSVLERVGKLFRESHAGYSA